MLDTGRTENCIHDNKDSSKQARISKELKELLQIQICTEIKYMPSKTQQEEEKLLKNPQVKFTLILRQIHHIQGTHPLHALCHTRSHPSGKADITVILREGSKCPRSPCSGPEPGAEAGSSEPQAPSLFLSPQLPP